MRVVRRVGLGLTTLAELRETCGHTTLNLVVRDGRARIGQAIRYLGLQPSCIARLLLDGLEFGDAMGKGATHVRSLSLFSRSHIQKNQWFREHGCAMCSSH